MECKNEKLINFLSIIIIAMFVLVGCSSTEQPVKAEQDNASVPTDVEPKSDEFIPQILFNGSSTLAPVMASISTNFIEKYVTWNKIDPSYPEENIAIYVSAGGSGQGVKSVIDNTSDFGMVARTVKDSEKEMLPELNEFKVGIDALTLGVNPNNPILSIKDDLTKEDIIKIFSGEYKTWNDLDPSLPEKEIVVVTRDIGGGAHEVFQSKIMGDVEVKADAIGYASFGVVNQNVGKIATLKVDGINATKENIINGSYIIQRPLIAICNDELTASQQSFIDYVMSEEGMDIAESMGFVPAK